MELLGCEAVLLALGAEEQVLLPQLLLHGERPQTRVQVDGFALAGARL